MQSNNQKISILETKEILLQLNGKLLQIDSMFDPEIEKLAQETIDNAVSIKKSQKEDIYTKIMVGGLDTFPLLHLDSFTLLRELQDKTVKTLGESIDNARVGIDITQYTYAQSVEIMRVLSFMSGYVSLFTDLAQKNTRKLSIEESVILLFRHLTQRIKREQRKAYQISQDLLQKAAIDAPTVKTYDLTFRPVLGYVTSYNLPSTYKEFRQDLKKTSDGWFAAGAIYGKRRFEQFKPSENTFRWIV
jgi:hypothetical protein